MKLIKKRLIRRGTGWAFPIPTAFINDGIFEEGEEYDLDVTKHKGVKQ